MALSKQAHTSSASRSISKQLKPSTARASTLLCVASATNSRSGARQQRVRSTTTTTAAPTATPTAAEQQQEVRTVQVDLGYAAEQAVVPLIHPNSRLVESTMQFPLGLVLENVDGEVVVTEVNEGSAAADADCRVGDVVRATTAFTMQMSYSGLQLMMGGGGRPKLMKILIPADKVPFSKVMDAVRSNTVDQGGDGSVTLVLERVEEGDSGYSSDGSSSVGVGIGGSNGSSNVLAEVGEAQASAEEESGAVFDPTIFNIKH